jgi:WD40 repeat protein
MSLKLVSSDLLASGSYDSTIKLWNVTSGTLLGTLLNHTDRIFWSIDMLSHSQLFISGSCDRTVNVWNICTGELIKQLVTNTAIRSFAVLSETTLTTCKRFKLN